MTKLSEARPPHFGLTESAAPSTPSTGAFEIYAATDGTLHTLNDAGTDTELGAGGGGSVATDAIWDAKGDLAGGTGADTASRLAVGANGTILIAASGEATGLKWGAGTGIPYEVDYTQFTAATTAITATTEGTANVIVTAGAVSFDGSTVCIVEFYAPVVDVDAAGGDLTVILEDGGTSIGKLAQYEGDNTSVTGHRNRLPMYNSYRFTPSNASHTFAIAGYTNVGTHTIRAGAGGAATYVPGYIRVSKLT